MQPFDWTCPFCNRHQVVTDENLCTDFVNFTLGESKYGDTGLQYTAVRCVNVECNEVTLVVDFATSVYNGRRGTYEAGKGLRSWKLLPENSSSIQPDYIPGPLREDYYEACLIRDKSPKAAATLARRCLQGMIRDFCGIAKGQLIDEIKELRKCIDDGNAPKGVAPETIDAIDAIRGIGNIGAHMEKDINLIIEVDPGEAQALIELIEMLFDEWYVARHKREQKLASVLAIAAEKKAAIAEGRAQIAQAKVAVIADQSSGV
ncbi:DUF4145 domain-containing protein [Rhizobium leguminosarum]|uniref:DUF4145 domain-containing protein n=1 Tax=Rhizobium leguminosarum TaxID=384 RepID=UPI003F94B9DB